MSIEVMRQALDALEEINKLSIGENAICLPAEIDTAMDALRQAIEQVEKRARSAEYDRAVEITQSYERAWKTATAEQPETVMAEYKLQTYAAYKSDGEMKIGVVPEQEIRQAEQAQPVAWGDVKVRPDGKRYCRAIATTDQSNLGYVPLYTAQPQRQPLTDEEIAKIASTPCAVVGSYVHTFARAIEAAHGIRE